eukprot:2266275-Alexandrium_andersonii.AAC.1
MAEPEVCSSWVFMSRATSWRTATRPMGDRRSAEQPSAADALVRAIRARSKPPETVQAAYCLQSDAAMPIRCLNDAHTGGYAPADW